MKKIKLVILTNMLPPYRIALFNELNKCSEIDLYVLVKDIKTKKREYWNLTPSINFNYSILESKNKHNLIISNFSFVRNLIFYLNRIEPNILVVGGYSLDALVGALFAKKKNIPFLIWTGETILSFKMLHMKWIRIPFRKALVKFANGFIAYGPAAKRYLSCQGVEKSKIIVINNICYSKPFFAFQKKIWNLENPKMVFVGELSEKKNVRRLVCAYNKVKQKHPKLRLELIGDGPLKQYLLEYIKKNQLENVIVRGSVPFRQLPKILSEAEFLILPSLYDQWPHVVMEAMAVGLPVLCSNTAGIPSYILQHEKNGLFFSPYSEDKIADAIEKMIKLKNKWKKMGQFSIEIAKTYSIEKSARLFAEAVIRFSHISHKNKK